jgi:hypothetical protein
LTDPTPTVSTRQEALDSVPQQLFLALGLAVAVAGIAGCAMLFGGRPPMAGGPSICNQYNAPSIPVGYDEDGCWHPDEYYEAPPEVIPTVGEGAPRLRIDASGPRPMGIEGTLFFVRVTSPTARVVLERTWEWPELEQEIPPGAYQVTAYARTCDGNCELLDPTMLSCTIDLVAEPSGTYTMSWEVHERGTARCRLLDR